MTLKWRAGVAGLMVVAALFASAGWAGADDGAWKAANDTDPHVPLTAHQQSMLAQKQQAVATLFSWASGQTVTADVDSPPGDAIVNVDAAALAAVASSASLLANQTPQQRAYWCGPAAVQEALGQMGIGVTQTTAAAKLGTTTDGTAWSGGSTSTHHPIPDVLNFYQGRNYFVPQAVTGSPSAGEITNYKNYLVANIVYIGAPIIGDAWETNGSRYHLNGHPPDRTIFHWFDIRGYTGSGANTMYEDSVHNAPTVSWYANVPAYSTMPSNEIVTIIGGRGYVW